MSLTLERDAWARLLDQLDDPAVGVVAEALADSRDVDVLDAYDVVETAVDEGDLLEEDAGGALPVVRLPETDETAETADTDPRGAGKRDDDPQGETVETPVEDDDRDTSGPSYRDLYLRAWANSDAKQALVPHEDIAPVFREAGYGDIIDHGALPYADWTVWTPDSRDEPLYAYTPDLAGDTSADRERVAELLAEAGLGTERFIDVLDGQKASFDTGNAREPDDEEIGGNYGVKGGRAGDTERWLVDIDVDDYDEAKESNPRVEALRGETLGVASAHTTTDRPGHLYVAVDGDAAAIARDVLGREVDNPAASFGEIRIENQYVVGPGSEIVCGCDLCEDPDTADHYGRYQLATERPPVVWSPEEFRDFLEADPAIEPDTGADADAEADTDHGSGRERGYSGSVSLDDADERVVFAKAVDDHVADAFRAVRDPDDRSAADSRLARAIAPWVGYDKNDISDVLDDHGTSKWQNRGHSYHSSIVDYATGRTTDAYDPVPYWALVETAVRDDLVDRDDLVERSSETGAVVDDAEAADTYTALPPGTYDDVLEHVEDTYGVDPGRDPAGGAGDDEDDTERPRDLLDLDVVVEPADAMQAARAVRPDDLDRDLPELKRDDVDDVAIAVALAEGVIDDADTFPRDDGYTDAYYRARDAYGAPLPKYLDNSTLEERFDLVTAAVERLGPEHILDTCRSEVTVENPSGHAIAKLDPTWEKSESGERIVAGYGAGFWCVEHDVSFSPLQLVALEHGIIDEETEYPTGEGYKRAYRLLREEYDAPLPRWRATVLEEVTVLPPSVRVIDDAHSATGGFDLAAARKETEALVRDAITTRDRAQLVTVVPGGGKTFSTAIVADDHPILYAPPRNELKKQMEQYAREIRESDEFDAEPTAYHLPILAENTLREEVLEAAVGAVRGDEVALGDREALLDVADGVREALEEDDSDGDAADDGVDLKRATCPTAEGEHGEAWRVAVQVARGLGLTPATIHQHEKALFGEELPCHDDGVCQYTAGWDRVRDAETCPDILIGSTGHAFVDSATTHYAEGEGDDRVTTPRAVVVDEFPGDDYATKYGERYMDHAVWLAEALADVENRDELLDAELSSDTWVSSWLEGDGGDVVAVGEAVEALRAGAGLVDAIDAAEHLLERDPLELAGSLTSANLRGVVDTLETIVETPPGQLDLGDVRETLTREEDQVASDAARAYADGREAGGLYTISDVLREDILDPVETAERVLDGARLDEAVAETTADLPIGGDLRDLVDDAISAARGDAPGELLTAAADALEGGRDGCRALAVGAPGGYAHPDAWALLAGAIARPEDDGVSVGRQRTLSLGDGGEGMQHKSLTVNGADIHADRDHHGAVVFDRPSFTDAEGGTCPLVGLDATARRDLWRIALGRDAEVRDIHDTVAERRRHIREGMKHTVVQTANTPLPYHGDPTGRNFQEDLAVVEAAAEEYTGAGGLDAKGPAVISTLKVLEYLGGELDDLADETVNYENMKGSDALGDHQVAVVLGSQHYGDTEPERWAMYAGESADRGDTSGETLDYGSGVANTYLKHMREDHTMQAILRAGRNDDRSVVVAHTSALRDDLPVVAEGATVSAHSKGALAVADAAADMNDRRFTAADVVEKIADDDRGVGLRQVQNILADLRSAGYLGVETEGSRGREFEYEFGDDPGLADVELPDGEAVGADQHKTKSELLDTYSWNFVLDSDGDLGESMLPPSRATIPATDTVEAVVADGDPPS